MTEEVLSTRRLNRALLARQMLLRREQAPVEEALERLVGMQAQVPLQPYFGLWSRVEGFDPEDLSRLIESRRAVRAALMRTTIHLVTARDCLRLRPLMAPVLERTLRSTPFGKGTVGLDLGEVVAEGRKLLEEQPRTLTELGRRLQDRWPDREAINLARTVHYLAPLVQVPPRGLWGRSMQATWTTVEHWLGRELEAEPSLDAVVLRYLEAFGPATASDMRTWSGLAGLSDALERLRPQLRTFCDEQGRELFDITDGLLPEEEVEAPVRFLPEYDNLFLSHADRSRIVDPELRRAFATANGVGPNSFAVDGFLSGSWRIFEEKRVARLVVDPVVELSTSQRNGLAAEGEALLRFAAAGAERREVEFRR
jgi:hypothetical protein